MGNCVLENEVSNTSVGRAESSQEKIDTKTKFQDEVKHIRKTIDSETTDFTSIASKFEDAINRYTDSDKKVFPSEKIMDKGIADKLIYIAENIDREEAEEAAKKRTREEWEKLEEEYSTEYVHMKLSWEDVESDLLDLIDLVKTEEQKQRAYDNYLTQITEYRQCEYVFCDGLIPHERHGGSHYCCDEHKWAHENAQKRFDETSKLYAAGTYLPEDYYIPKRSSSIEKQYVKMETSREPQILTEVIMKNELGDRRRSEKQQFADVYQQKKSEFAYYTDLNKKQPVTSYNLHDLGIEELQERKLSQYISLKTVI